MKKRKYFGTVLLDKAYRGEKSINLEINKEEGVKLAKNILSAIMSGSKFDLAIHDSKKRKDNKISMTVTQAIR